MRLANKIALLNVLILCSLAGKAKGNVSSKDSIVQKLSLAEVVSLAIEQSPSVRNAQNVNINYYWRWRNFKTRYRPQLILSGNLPNYTQSNVGVTQPDGSLQFVNVTNLSTSAKISLNQSIPFTGTSVYASTSAIRFQDYNKNTVNFSGSPFSIGFTQPVFAINWMKWAQKTEPMIHDEAQKNFIESIERISYNSVVRFFRFLLVQTNFNLAENNLKNSRNNLRIAQTKKDLGTISDNDFARIQLAVLNAEKALSSARFELKNADFELKSYIGLSQDLKIGLEMPLSMMLFEVDPEKAVEQAINNRKETTYFQRRLVEADRDLKNAKRSNGLSATLQGSYGLSNSAESLGGVYQKPERQQTLSLSLSIPILDWGQSASTVKLAESQRDLVIYDVEKDKEDFERSVVVQVEQFGLLKDQLKTAKEADKVAEDGYKIALKHFQNGEISITELNISQNERENAKRDYIRSLETYWEAYYNLRILTLYDFEKNEPISYGNPLSEKQ
jgi:outer membrane protein TolC